MLLNKKEKLKKRFINGEVLLINKPLNWTSFQVVKKIKSILYQKLAIKKIKIGHSGTLDPLAEGLLVICSGKMTKIINEIQNYKKSYEATITLGATTPSFDLETPFNKMYCFDHVNEKLINETKKKFIGEIYQKPPIFSALKIQGKRLYEYARINKHVEIKSRKVNIYKFEIIKVKLPNIDLKIKCSKGTYVRSIANDFGENLGSGAYLSKLKRTEIGKFKLTQSKKIGEFEKYIDDQL